MPFQIVFVIEADERSRSDYIYIRSVLNEWYDIRMRNDVKIAEVFMGGKGNYNKRRIINQIKVQTKNYSRLGRTHVIYCFDTDKYDSNPDDRKVLAEEEEYCRNNGFEFVWFCHDIEEVFLGYSVAKSEKTDKARQYSANSGIKNVDKNNLKSDMMAKRKSNLLVVLEKCFLQSDT